MLRVFNADLHIHTCLSPCASLDMTPQKIIREAVRKKLSIIAITDHNSAENVEAVIRAARYADLTDLLVIPGMEVTTSEEAHIIALFTSVDNAVSMQEIVFDHLLPGENDEDLFGLQVIANEHDEVEGLNDRLLIGATTMSVDEVIETIHKLQGLAVAAHIDRESYSLIGQLGFIPENLELDGIEVSRRLTIDKAKFQFREYTKFPFVISSDAHNLNEIGVCITSIILEKLCMNEFRMALEGRGGRQVLSEPKEGQGLF
ncbi:MAG: PHP domain-containing protein [Spirochaetota bacterium]|nr:PHP domain-containing protein [Spirochaetota bacterium]